MKTKISTFLLIMGLVITMGCSSDSDGDNIPSAGTIVMNMNGTEWRAMGATGLRQSLGGNVQISTAGSVLGATISDLETFSFAIISPSSQPIGEGDYIVRSGLPYLSMNFTLGSAANQANWVATSGTLSISKYTDDNFQGTFSGTLERSGHPNREITNGRFNVNVISP